MVSGLCVQVSGVFFIFLFGGLEEAFCKKKIFISGKICTNLTLAYADRAYGLNHGVPIDCVHQCEAVECRTEMTGDQYRMN